MKLVDANVFLRYLTRDDEVKAQACHRFFERLRNGAEQATTCEAVIAEIVYVLGSKAHYALTHEEISARLRPLLALRGLRLLNKRVLLHALDVFATYPALDFEDALLVAHSEGPGMDGLLSYDTDFDRVPGVQRSEPL